MDLKEIKEMVREVESSSIGANYESNISRAQLLASWAIAEQLAVMNELTVGHRVNSLESRGR
jgi:hypothetical protein